MRQLGTAVVALVGFLTLLSEHWLAQESGAPRRLAPGVLTTIPVEIEEESVASGPRRLVEIVVGTDVNDWEPNYSPQSETLEELSRRVVVRRMSWEVEFSFKPLRMLAVEVPDATGQQMQTKLVWYMVYRIRNLGNHLQPTPGAFSADDRADLVMDGEYGQFQFLPADHPAGIYPDGTYGSRPVDRSVRCFPNFVLEIHDEGQTSARSYLDRILPSAMAAIGEREDPNIQFLSTVEISQTSIAVSTEQEDHAVWGIAMWEDIDPTADFLSIYIQGLNNAYHWEDPDGAWSQGDPPGEGREFTYKTLQLNFWRPGDVYDEEEQEIRYGLPVMAEEHEIQRLLQVYDIPEPLDFLWIYR